MNKWWQNQEKGNAFWLNLSLILISSLPKFIIKFILSFIVLFYFIFASSQRKAINKFYENLYFFKHKKNINFTKKNFLTYLNFYEFGLAFADKIRLWENKISHDNIKVKDEKNVLSMLKNQKRGKILLSFHYGNIEIARGFENKLGTCKIYILMYAKASKKFLSFMNKITNNSINIILVEDLDITNILKLEKIIQEGHHIGIMADRTSISNSKSIKADFLGKATSFPQGPFFLAHILNAQIATLACVREKNFYNVEFNLLKSEFKQRQEKINDLSKQYIKILENYVCQKPSQWFNFYDFWSENA